MAVTARPLDPVPQAAAAYDALAPAYDELTSHHRYDEWTSDLERLALAHGLRGTRLLDVGCGTGKSFIPFLARGYAVTACDSSPEMLARARSKPAAAGARLLLADMRRMGLFGLTILAVAATFAAVLWWIAKGPHRGQVRQVGRVSQVRKTS